MSGSELRASEVRAGGCSQKQSKGRARDKNLASNGLWELVLPIFGLLFGGSLGSCPKSSGFTSVPLKPQGSFL